MQKLRVIPGGRVSKGQATRIRDRAVGRLTPEQQLALLNSQAPEDWAGLLEDEATRSVVPNRAARREQARGTRLNVKQAAKREAYLARVARRRAQYLADLRAAA